MARLLFAAACMLAACGGDDRDFTPDVARSVYELANGRLVELHEESVRSGTFPDRLAGPCEGGGTVEMVPGATPAGAHVPDLAHPFEDCVLGGYTFDGNLDYTHIVECDAGGVTYDIVGEVTVAGYGPCAMMASKMCDVLVRAESCGFSLVP